VRRVGKFEWKIMVALLVTAVTPLAFTTVIVDRLVRDSMSVGVNDRVLEGLRIGVDLFKEVIESRLRLARLEARALVHDPALLQALQEGRLAAVSRLLEDTVASQPTIARARLLAAGQPVAEASSGEFPPQDYKSRLESWEIAGNYRLEFTLVIDRQFLKTSDNLRELVLTLEEVKKNFGPWQIAYYRLFLFIYVWILGMTMVVAVVLARSVTKRVTRLVQATRLAAGGNLDVRVQVRGRDEIGQLSASFNLMLDEIRRSRDRIVYLEKVSAWQGMAQRLAHEIKNPLTPIQLAVQELHRSYRGDDDSFKDKLDDSLEIVEEEVGTLRRLVETFAEFAKMPPVQAEPVELNAYLADLLKHNPHLAGRVKFIPGPAQQVQLDRVMMGRAIINLINNGLEASPEHQQVELTSETGQGWVTVRVADSGQGLSVEARERLFQPYFTTKPQGTGLGLAIVKKIVLQHGGEITVTDRNPHGTVFEIRLRTDKQQIEPPPSGDNRPGVDHGAKQ